jgi:hypothetical protein
MEKNTGAKKGRACWLAIVRELDSYRRSIAKKISEKLQDHDGWRNRKLLMT